MKAATWIGFWIAGFFGLGTVGAIAGSPWDTIALIVMAISAVLGMIAWNDA